MGQRERYIVGLEDGKRLTVIAATFQEVLQMFGEENVVTIEKLDYDEEAMNKLLAEQAAKA